MSSPKGRQYELDGMAETGLTDSDIYVGEFCCRKESEDDEFDWADASIAVNPRDLNWVTVFEVEPSDTCAIQDELTKFGDIDMVYVRVGRNATHIQFENQDGFKKALAAGKIRIKRNGVEDDGSELEIQIYEGKITTKPEKKEHLHSDVSSATNKGNTAKLLGRMGSRKLGQLHNKGMNHKKRRRRWSK